MIHAVWRCLTEGGGVRGTGSSCDYPLRPWVCEEDVGLGFGRGLLDELMLFFFGR